MKKRSLAQTKVLLSVINGLKEEMVDFVDLWVALGTHYGSAYGRGGQAYVAELKHNVSQRELKMKLYQLERRKYLKIKRQGKKFSIVLTDKGIGYNKVRAWKGFKQHKSGWFTVVIFDIPEQMSLQRRQWRILLRIGGFSKLQQSVWVSKNDCYEAVVDFVKGNKADKWINVYQATNFLKQPQ